jgi:prevent-host-death family protein
MSTATITAHEAKLHFWKFLDTAQKKTVIVTKNSKPIWVMISIEDAKNFLIWDIFLEQEKWYDDFFVEKVKNSLSLYNSWKNTTKKNDEVMTDIWSKI